MRDLRRHASVNWQINSRITLRGCTANALAIDDAGYFSIELSGQGRFVMRLNRDYKSEDEKIQTLKWAATAWTQKLRSMLKVGLS